MSGDEFELEIPSSAVTLSKLGGRKARTSARNLWTARVVRVGQLPKTRSAKIMRRAIRAAVLDTDPGDLSGAENPEAVQDIRSQVKELG